MTNELNPGGRKKSQPGPTTQKLQESLQKIFYDEIGSGRLESALKKLKAEDYIKAMRKLAPYIPKISLKKMRRTVPLSYFSSHYQASRN